MNLRCHWRLHPEIDFLNHGCFGATPTVVLETQRRLMDELEREPVRFLAPERDLEPKLDRVRQAVARLVRADASEIGFVRNATDGVNAVLRSFPFNTGDEVVVTNHGYNACRNAAHEAARRSGAVVRTAEVPFPLAGRDEVIEAIEHQYSRRTRLLLVDHVTSPTGLVFPLQEIVERAHARNVRVLVDGAHAPGMVPLALHQIGADYYTANHHKWLCAPKASGFLWVRPEWQDEVRPTVISHAANRTRPGRSRFLAEFDWAGTFDPTPLLAVDAALNFLGSLHADGIDGWMASNRALALQAQKLLAGSLGIALPAPAEMIGSLVSVPLPTAIDQADERRLDSLQERLFSIHRIEVPVFPGPTADSRILRVSIQAYNDLDQILKLQSSLQAELRHPR